jgi:hypothetical protein
MEPHIPDVEILMVFKWMLILMLASSIAMFAGLLTKKIWYSTLGRNRRIDEPNDRGWVDRFLESQQQYIEATTKVEQSLNNIQGILEDNGRTLKDVSAAFRCGYQAQSPGRHRAP